MARRIETELHVLDVEFGPYSQGEWQVFCHLPCGELVAAWVRRGHLPVRRQGEFFLPAGTWVDFLWNFDRE
jgi:hypothetical protein